MPFRNPRLRLALLKPLVCVPVLALLALALFPAYSPAREAARAVDPDELWYSRIEPLLDKYCLKCHAGVRQRGGLDLRSLDTILRGGDSGPALLPGKPNESRIMQYVLPASQLHMPPDSKKQLSGEEIAVLKTWIACLPAPKLKTASVSATSNAWVGEYLVQYRRSRQPQEVPPANLPAPDVIDWFLQADWRRERIEPSRVCDNAAFARRIYLDIAGRIPTPQERALFLTDARSDKRQRLTSQLMGSDDYPRHMREVFDTALMGRPNNNTARQRADSGWNAFLEDAFRANRAWNETVREMLVARPTNNANRGAVWFLAERNNNHQAMAEAVAPVVFGVQIGCAQCHNHPLAWEIEQRHYWGMVAAFNRSKNVAANGGTEVGESAVGGFINFANLKKESQPAALVFLNGKSVPERVPAANEKEVDNPDLYLPSSANNGAKASGTAVPKFSRRAAFAESVTRDNPLLARAFVNRIWATFMGRGFTAPVDQIDSRHRPSHPELLAWLTHDFEQSGYDIKRLIRSIVSTRAYQLDTRPSGKTLLRPESFARALEKPLSAEQLLHSLWVATGAKIEGKPTTETERAFVTTFPDVMPDTYSPSLQQALFLSNSPLIEDLLKPVPGSTTAKLLTFPSNAARIREAFSAVLGRAPDTTEMQRCQTLLAAQAPEKGVKNLLWALLTCAEFQMNH